MEVVVNGDVGGDDVDSSDISDGDGGSIGHCGNDVVDGDGGFSEGWGGGVHGLFCETHCIEDSCIADPRDEDSGDGDVGDGDGSDGADDGAKGAGNVGGDRNRRSWWYKWYYLTLNQQHRNYIQRIITDISRSLPPAMWCCYGYKYIWHIPLVGIRIDLLRRFSIHWSCPVGDSMYK